jgi:hypothetical protein
MSKNQSKTTPAGNTSKNAEAAYIFLDALKAHSDDDAKAFALKIGAGFDERVQFEISSAVNGSADLSIVKKLNAARARLAMPSVAKVLMELGKSEAFINATHSKDGAGKRFNINAINKVIDIVLALGGAKKLENAHNVAIAKSMLNFEEAGVTFTAEFAQMASSDKIRSQDPNVKLLRRYTVDKATAGTQASSTLGALQALGLIINTGTRRAGTYVFANTNQAKAFKEILKAV